MTLKNGAIKPLGKTNKKKKIIKLEQLNKEVKKLERKCEEYLNGWRRAQADYQNLAKQMEKEKKELIKFANESLILELLPILDNFKAAFQQVPVKTEENSWLQGFQHIKKQLENLLNSYGIEEIKTVGQKFDPYLHEAVGYEEGDEQYGKQKKDKKGEKGEKGEYVEGMISKEVSPGYKFYGKVLRPAKVIVKK